MSYNNIAVSFENVSKIYRLGLVGTGTLSQDLNRWWKMNILRQEDPYLKIGQTNDRSTKGTSDFVYALKDIDIKIEKGDVVGIIGKNGAGKSTLLKLLSRITAPTTGQIKTRGRLASLLEVGTGFHPELTGRENIYMNGSIMGMTKSEIKRKLDEIIDFAGVERYIDTPCKRYSSGMQVRLGFAVAAFLEPEILVVDEVLAVGDAEFQRKAIGKMQDVSSKSGRTVLFVSHNMASIRSLCNNGIVLNNGMIDFIGSSNDAIQHYLSKSIKINSESKILDYVKIFKNTLSIERVLFNGTEGITSTVVACQETIEIRIKGNTSEAMTTDVYAVFKNESRVPMATLAEGHYKGKMINIPSGDFEIVKHIQLPKYIAQGRFIVDLGLHHPNVEYQIKCDDVISVSFDGFVQEYGKPLKQSEDGFFGLETI